MINLQVDVKAAIDKLDTLGRLTNFNQPSERANFADLIADFGKNSFANNSMQRIMTNRSPLVRGPYTTGKRKSIRKFVKSKLNPDNFFISYVSRQKNYAIISIGIDLSAHIGMPPDKYSPEAGLFSQIMGPLIPYDFAGLVAADAIKIRHFGSGIKGNQIGYPKRIYPNQINLFVNFNRQNGGIVAKFLRADTLQNYLNTISAESQLQQFGHSGYDIEDKYSKELSGGYTGRGKKNTGLGGSRKRGAYGVSDQIASQLGYGAMDQIARGEKYATIQIAKKLQSPIDPYLILWHEGVPTYGWFRDFTGRTYQSDIDEIAKHSDDIIREFLKMHGII